MKQLIFIDDSGDPGFKFNHGSSKVFVIACIIFDNQDEAEFTSAGIKLLKDKVNWKQHREFKFNKTNDEQRKIFFSEVKHYDFRVRATVVDKTKLTGLDPKDIKNFYTLIISRTLERFSNMKGAIVKLDGSGNRSFRRQLASDLRKSLNKNGERKVSNFSLEDSQSNIIIQLTDMVAGAIRLRYSPNKNSTANYIRPLVSKIEDIWIYHKTN